jgi:hypothetical protein
MRFHNLLAVVLALGLAGCSTYRPADRSILDTGDAVRLHLTEEETAEQAPELGSFRDNLVGTIQEMNQASLGLTIDAAQAEGTPMARRFKRYIEIPWDGVAAVERRQFSWQRTTLAAVAAGLVTWFVLDASNFSGGGGDEPPNVNQNRITIPLGG